jgi:hypothetical protein
MAMGPKPEGDSLVRVLAKHLEDLTPAGQIVS